jgi:type I restriction enzyme S subunit
MQSSHRKLGSIVQLVDIRNKENAIQRVLGMNVHKAFMPSVANVQESDLTNYKVITKGQFAYSAMQVGRDETIRVALFDEDEPAIISPAYNVFEVIDSEVFPEYLMMIFHQPEFNRYGWFISDGSVRASVEWERFVEIEIPLPSYSKQQGMVKFFSGLSKLSAAYSVSVSNLEKACNGLAEKLIQECESKPLGSLISLVDERNSELKLKRILGVNVKKTFMPTVANTTELDVSKYKVVRQDTFACNLMHVGRDEVFPVSLSTNEEPFLVSPAYFTFRASLGVEASYLMMIFSRPEFDRLAWFISDSSIRGGLEWSRLCELKIPVPSTETQKDAARLFRSLQQSRVLSSSFSQMAKAISPILISGMKSKEVKTS